MQRTALLCLIFVGLTIGGCGRSPMIASPTCYETSDLADESGLYPIRQNSKVGFIDRAGHVVIEPQFDEACGFSEGLSLAAANGRWGYIDQSGEFVIPPQYDYAEHFLGGIAFVEKDDQFTYIDRTGQLVTEVAGQVSYSDGSRSATWKVPSTFVDRRSGREIRNPQREVEERRRDFVPAPTVQIDQFEGYSYASEGFMAVQADGKWGYINQAGEFVIEPQFSNFRPFSEGLVAVQVGNKWGYMNRMGEFVIQPQFASVSDFSEGLAAVSLKPDQSEWGYVNRSGDFAIAPQFNGFAQNFDGGLALVNHDNIDYYIDQNGRVVWQSTKSWLVTALHFVQDFWGSSDKVSG
jgi:hypothetical protein